MADGVEPPSSGSEPDALPIDHAAIWSVWQESNLRMPGLQSGALSLLATNAFGCDGWSCIRLDEKVERVLESSLLSPSDQCDSNLQCVSAHPLSKRADYLLSHLCVYGDGGGRRTHKAHFCAHRFSRPDRVATRSPRHIWCRSQGSNPGPPD